jgi:hypothetical protein
MSALRHCIQRAKERYGLEFTAFDLCVLKELIISDRAIAMNGGFEGRTIYLVRYEEVTLKLIFDEADKKIITILPNSSGLRNPNRKRRGKMLRRNAWRRQLERTNRANTECWAVV